MGILSKLFSRKKSEPAPKTEFERRAGELGERVTEVATEFVRDLAETGRVKLSADETLVECVLALLHFVDKQSFHVLGPAGRDRIMDVVRTKAIAAIIFVRFPADEEGLELPHQLTLIEEVSALYNERMRYYAPLELIYSEEDLAANRFEHTVGYALGKLLDPDEGVLPVLLSGFLFEYMEMIQVKHGLRELLEDARLGRV